jgi:hypothetical protein
MSDANPERRRLSPNRQNIIELMRLARNLPLVTAERRMNLGPLADVRGECAVKIPWSLIFIKAFAIVAARRPELRTALVGYPYPHLYEHPWSIGTIMIERVHRGEAFPINCQFRKPERTPLIDLNQQMEHFRTVPLEDDRHFQRLQWLGRLPWLVRRVVWVLAYHWRGKKRAHYFGTFGLSSPAAHGAGLCTIVSPLSCTLHYGLFDANHQLDMRLTFDHRVLDGAPVARALGEMEEVLLTDLHVEFKQMAAARQAA